MENKICKPEKENSAEHIDQYINIMIQCIVEHSLYDEALSIGNSILCEALALFDNDENFTESFRNFVYIMARAQTFSAEDSEEKIRQLAESVDNAYYFDENLAGLDNVSKILVLREKALALYRLSLSVHISDDIKGTYWQRALECINKAVDMEVYDENSNSIINRFSILCYRALILSHKSYAIARRSIMDVFHTLTDTDDDEYPMECYNTFTQRLFDSEYNPQWLMAIKETADVSEEVREEVYHLLLKKYFGDDADRCLSQTFTRAIKPEERQTILIVENILEAAHVDFNKIHQVFTTDRIPHDITFDGERQPTAGMIYSINPDNSSDYNTFCKYDGSFNVPPTDSVRRI